MTALDGAPDTTIPESLRGCPDPAFAEPWQARAFALAILASKQGCFTWPEWTHALALELRQASQPDSRSGGRSYFDCWLRALQALLVGKGAVDSSELSERRRAWEAAYRQTPHGLPVSLSAPAP